MDIPENKVTEFLTKPAVLITMLVATVILIVLDIFLAGDDVSGNTWSELIRDAGTETPVVPWLAGLVMGHWFHPHDEAKPALPAPFNLLAIVIATIIVWAIGLGVTIAPWLPVIPGAVIGAWLWPVAVEKRTLDEIKEANQ